jgi:hypothetical protein
MIYKAFQSARVSFKGIDQIVYDVPKLNSILNLLNSLLAIMEIFHISRCRGIVEFFKF